jgi:alginate O-acetyltransferase complex protein AlgI
MLFNSWEFLVFFPVVTTIYFMAPAGLRYLVLLVASCVFYMAFVPAYLLILVLTIGVDYIAGIQIEKTHGGRRTMWFLGSIISTCLILFFFKYYDFFAWNFNKLAGWLHSSSAITPLNLLLPIGLSFHTFQSLSYVIEVYCRRQKAEQHFGIYALYVMFYPQLVAGPIERPQNLLHQFHDRHNFALRFDYPEVTSGLRLMAVGLFKKAVVADTLAQFVSPVYNHASSFTGGVCLVATVMFTFQIYCDFSGYSDMARGAARVMGFNLMLNFNNPYSASSLADFWRRWHISLSTWLRDYIYEPIAMSLRDWGISAIVTALMVTFLISGFWHGANWTYVIWGLLHGFGLSLEVVFSKQRKKLTKKIPSWFLHPILVAATFSYVTLTYVFFRAKTVDDACFIIRHIADWIANLPFKTGEVSRLVSALESVTSPQQLKIDIILIAVIVTMDALESSFKIGEKLVKSAWWIRWPAYQAAVLAIAYFGQWLGARSFIYFQF